MNSLIFPTFSKQISNMSIFKNNSTTSIINSIIISSTNKRAYHPKVIEHYTNPRNVGSLDKKLSNVGTGIVGAPACGDVIKLQIQVNDTTGVIENVKFKTFGCGSAIASSSYMTELVHGMKIDDAQEIKNTRIAKELSLPPVKLHCSMLAEDAIKAAIKDYKTKRTTQTKLH
ncbi:iron sulfur cluster assembly protein 1, mitochondrial [Monosporozyma servazzii]